MIVKDKVVEFFQDLSLGTAQETWKIMHIANWFSPNKQKPGESEKFWCLQN